jgi:RadC-like JAB domain-containing protein
MVGCGSSTIPLRTVWRANALRWITGYAACGITGDPLPSEADVRLTRRILEASKILQIQLMDRVIIGQPVNGNQGYFSFKEGGLIG